MEWYRTSLFKGIPKGPDITAFALLLLFFYCGRLQDVLTIL